MFQLLTSLVFLSLQHDGGECVLFFNFKLPPSPFQNEPIRLDYHSINRYRKMFQQRWGKGFNQQKLSELEGIVKSRDDFVEGKAHKEKLIDEFVDSVQGTNEESANRPEIIGKIGESAESEAPLSKEKDDEQIAGAEASQTIIDHTVERVATPSIKDNETTSDPVHVASAQPSEFVVTPSKDNETKYGSVNVSKPVASPSIEEHPIISEPIVEPPVQPSNKAVNQTRPIPQLASQEVESRQNAPQVPPPADRQNITGKSVTNAQIEEFLKRSNYTHTEVVNREGNITDVHYIYLQNPEDRVVFSKTDKTVRFVRNAVERSAEDDGDF